MGRPSKLSPELQNEICERLANGQPLAIICRDDHMPSFATIWRWEKENEEFREVSARAREHGCHFLAGDSIRIADDLEIDAQHKRIMIDTRIRLIGKWNAKSYGDKVALTDADGKNLPVPFFQINAGQPAES